MPVDEIEAREGMEWLLPAGNGGYASGRVLGPRSRSYHGLFVAALPEPGDRVLVLAQVDERVVAEDGRLLGTISKNTLLKFLDRTTDADGNPLPTATAEPSAHPAPMAAEPA